MEPTQPIQPQQPNGFNQPGQTFSPQGQTPNPGQPLDAGDEAVPGPQDPVDPQQTQILGQQLVIAQQQLRTAADTKEASMLNQVFEQLANESIASLPPATESTEGELIIRPQQPNGNWNGDNNGNSSSN